MGIFVMTGLLSTRFALLSLGEENFGIFSVISGIVSFIVIIDTIMLSTSNRFIAIAIGKHDEIEINKTFNVNFLIHIVLALLTLFIALPIGYWYIDHYVNYIGNINNIHRIFAISVIGSVFSFVGVPYNGLLMAKEKFPVFCLTDMILYFIKLFVCYMMLNHFVDKLLVYTLINVFVVSAPVLVYVFYCYRRFKSYVTIRLVKEKKRYKEILSFSIWVGYGAIASVGKGQGAALIINRFFSAILNASLGLANTVNAIILNFSNNVSKSISPQIVKSYASGQMDRCLKLVCSSSKVSFLLTCFISIPFLICPNFIFMLWLGKIPEKLVMFTQLMIIDNIIRSLNAGIPDLVFATGKIKLYQFCENTILILSVIFAYFVLYIGFPAEYLLVTYIIFSIIVFLVRQFLLSRIIKLGSKQLVHDVYIKSLFVVILFVPIIYLPIILHPIFNCILAFIYLMVLAFFISLTQTERKTLFLIVSIKK